MNSGEPALSQICELIFRLFPLREALNASTGIRSLRAQETATGGGRLITADP